MGRSFASGDQTRITLTVTDADTGAPLENARVEIMAAAFGNATVSLSGLTLVGYTDACGYVSALAPVDLATYSSHGMVAKGTFALLITHCVYGQEYTFYNVGEAHKSFSYANKPWVYDLKAFTDASKSFIRVEWKTRKSVVRTYEVNQDWNPSIYTAKGTWLYKSEDGGGLNKLVYDKAAADYTEDEIHSFTDLDVIKGGRYTYWVNGGNAGSAEFPSMKGCGPMVGETFTIDLNDETPETISFLPLEPVTPCPLVPSDLAGIGAYPTPYHNRLTIELDESFEGAVTLSVVNTLGEELYVSENLEPVGKHEYALDLSALPAGIQLLKVSARGKAVTYRIVKAN